MTSPGASTEAVPGRCSRSRVTLLRNQAGNISFKPPIFRIDQTRPLTLERLRSIDHRSLADVDKIVRHFSLDGSRGSDCKENSTPEALAARLSRRVVLVRKLDPAGAFLLARAQDISDTFVWIAVVQSVGDVDIALCDCTGEGNQYLGLLHVP